AARPTPITWPRWPPWTGRRGARGAEEASLAAVPDELALDAGGVVEEAEEAVDEAGGLGAKGAVQARFVVDQRQHLRAVAAVLLDDGGKLAGAVAVAAVE